VVAGAISERREVIPMLTCRSFNSLHIRTKLAIAAAARDHKHEDLSGAYTDKRGWWIKQASRNGNNVVPHTSDIFLLVSTSWAVAARAHCSVEVIREVEPANGHA